MRRCPWYWRCSLPRPARAPPLLLLAATVRHAAAHRRTSSGRGASSPASSRSSSKNTACTARPPKKRPCMSTRHCKREGGQGRGRGRLDSRRAGRRTGPRARQAGEPHGWMMTRRKTHCWLAQSKQGLRGAPSRCSRCMADGRRRPTAGLCARHELAGSTRLLASSTQMVTKQAPHPQ